MAPRYRRFYLRRLFKVSACCSVVLGLWFNLTALNSYHTQRSNQLHKRQEGIKVVAEEGRSVSETGTGRGDTKEDEIEAINSLEVFPEESVLLDFGDDLCVLSPDDYDEGYSREAWEATITDDLFRMDSVPSKGANSEESSESSSTSIDVAITDAKSVVSVGKSYKTEFRIALAFAFAKIVETKIGDILQTCNFVHFNKEESQHVWRLAQRRVVLDKFCRRYDSFFTRPRNIYKNLLWDTSTHLGYCPVFKTGTTSWMSRLVDWKGADSDKLNTKQVHKIVNKFYPALKPAVLAKEIEEHQPLLFTVARHPFIRVVSAYVNRILDGYLPITRMIWIKEVRGKSFADLMAALSVKIARQNPEDKEAASIQNLLRIKVDPSDNTDFEAIGDPSSDSGYLTFREFVRWIIWSTVRCLEKVDCLLYIDEHWQPQYVQCSPCTMRYDVISKTETFDDDANLILKLVGRADNMTIHPSGSALPLSGNARGPAKRRNISLGSSAAEKTIEYLSTLTKEEIRLLYVAYYLDFTLFGFSPTVIV